MRQRHRPGVFFPLPTPHPSYPVHPVLIWFVTGNTLPIDVARCTEHRLVWTRAAYAGGSPGVG